MVNASESAAHKSGWNEFRCCGEVFATLGALIQEVSAEFMYESSYIVWVA